MKGQRNPLHKRLPREFNQELGKYLVVFIFITATIGFVSGFLVADGSMIEAYNESFSKYNVEYGNFEIADEADEELIKKLEDSGVNIYKNYYMEKESDNNNDGKYDSKLRIYTNRTEVDKVCLMKGNYPEAADEIAVDRMFAENNKIDVNDKINVDGRTLKISGLVALSDYSSLFENNGDVMFDAIKFGVAVMTKEGYAEFIDKNEHYNYAWTYRIGNNDSNESEKSSLNEKEEKQKADTFLKILNENTSIVKYIPRYNNQAIQFTGNDMGSDKSLITTLLYILIAILAFVFAVTTNNTIVNEASVIGTLRASGYTRGELLRHYLALPLITTFIAAIVGNILGYTIFKDICAGLYYGSYSLPTYKTVWNMEAFLLTTIIPMIIMIIINIAVIAAKLKMSPLKFIRHDFSKNKNRKAIKLPQFKFFNRFRIRIVLQNLSSYSTLLIGIIFAYVLLLFGMAVSPLLEHYQTETIKNMISDYQYILKVPEESENEQAEKFLYTSLEISSKQFADEEVSIFGIEENSKFVDANINNDEIFVSDTFAEKYQLKKGDILKLKDKYDDTKFIFKIKGIYTYPAAISVFMNDEYFRKKFNLKEDYFNGYFSNEKLTDIRESNIASVITEDDLTKVSRQLNVSMGEMFEMVNIFATILFLLLVYLLTKLIIEKNATSISMVKILGYEDGEIAKLYLLSTTFVVIFSIIISMWSSTLILSLLYRSMMAKMSGWLSYYIKPDIYPKMFLIGLAAYAVVAILQFVKIRKIPMDEALKNVE